MRGSNRQATVGRSFGDRCVHVRYIILSGISAARFDCTTTVDTDKLKRRWKTGTGPICGISLAGSRDGLQRHGVPIVRIETAVVNKVKAELKLVPSLRLSTTVHAAASNGFLSFNGKTDRRDIDVSSRRDLHLVPSLSLFPALFIPPILRRAPVRSDRRRN